METATPIIGQTSTKIPTIYMWEDHMAGTLTAAFKHGTGTYGYSYPLNPDLKERAKEAKKLGLLVKESLDVLVHHGEKVLDRFGNIDPAKVNEEEASRYYFDPMWDRRVKALNQLVRIHPISRKQAVILGLLEA